MLRCLARNQGAILLTCLSSLVALSPVAAQAQPKAASAASSAASKPTTAPKSSTGPAWSELKPAEQVALKPLQNEWASIDDMRKRKWLRIAEHYPTMSESGQALLQTRMAEWAKMTPQERSKVRLHYLETRKIPATNRQADWKAYQALSPEERKALAARATPAPRAATNAAAQAPRSSGHGRDTKRSKSSTVAAAASAPAAKPATTTVVQGTPGATTVLITKRAAPPAQQTPGARKIAVTADVVDKSTLLPRAGAQSAHAPPAAASKPAAQP